MTVCVMKIIIQDSTMIKQFVFFIALMCISCSSANDDKEIKIKVTSDGSPAKDAKIYVSYLSSSSDLFNLDVDGKTTIALRNSNYHSIGIHFNGLKRRVFRKQILNEKSKSKGEEKYITIQFDKLPKRASISSESMYK